jgi:hypothetical protein
MHEVIAITVALEKHVLGAAVEEFVVAEGRVSK